jgi:hypothetical protein
MLPLAGGGISSPPTLSCPTTTAGLCQPDLLEQAATAPLWSARVKTTEDDSSIASAAIIRGARERLRWTSVRRSPFDRRRWTSLQPGNPSRLAPAQQTQNKLKGSKVTSPGDARERWRWTSGKISPFD